MELVNQKNCNLSTLLRRMLRPISDSVPLSISSFRVERFYNHASHPTHQTLLPSHASTAATAAMRRNSNVSMMTSARSEPNEQSAQIITTRETPVLWTIVQDSDDDQDNVHGVGAVRWQRVSPGDSEDVEDGAGSREQDLTVREHASATGDRGGGGRGRQRGGRGRLRRGRGGGVGDSGGAWAVEVRRDSSGQWNSHIEECRYMHRHVHEQSPYRYRG